MGITKIRDDQLDLGADPTEINLEDIPDGATRQALTTGVQTVDGVKTFGSIPVLPASDPTTDNQAARKKYVDDSLFVLSADCIKDTHIDWGAGADQVDADDVPESTERQWLVPNRDNLLPDEDCSFEGGSVGNWAAALNCGLANDSANGYHGFRSLRMAVTANGAANATNTLTALTDAGAEYTLAARFLGVAGREYRVMLYDDVALYPGGIVIGDGTWQTATVTATFNGASVARKAYIATTGTAMAGDIVYWDACILKAGASATPPTVVSPLTNAAQTIAGIKTFSSIPILPASDPIADNDAARKKYVDDQLSGADHGELAGLDGDDHTQYYNEARGDARYYTQAILDIILSGGWFDANETWTYVSVDAPSYVFSIVGDKTDKYSVGMRIKLSDSGIQYFIITGVTWADPNTNITVYGGTDYSLSSSAISSPCFAMVKAPHGFPLDPDVWSVEVTDATNRTEDNPIAATWYNLDGGANVAEIDIPIGIWRVRYKVIARFTATAEVSASVYTTLSTANDAESDKDFTAQALKKQATSGACNVICTHTPIKVITLSTKDTYYLNTKTSHAGGTTQIGNLNTTAPLVITAECAYL